MTTNPTLENARRLSVMPRARFFLIVGALVLTIFGVYHLNDVATRLHLPAPIDAQNSCPKNITGRPYAQASPTVSPAPVASLESVQTPLVPPVDPPKEIAQAPDSSLPPESHKTNPSVSTENPARPSPVQTAPVSAPVPSVAPVPPASISPSPSVSAPVTLDPPLDGDNLSKVRETRKFYFAADRSDGKIVLRTGGSVTWRLNNMGRMKDSDFAKSMGAIGSDANGNAIFPSYEKGRLAVETYLFSNVSEYHAKPLNKVFSKETTDYIVHLTGLSRDLVLDDMRIADRERFLNAIQEAEGWIPGKVSVFDNEEDFKKNGW